MFFGKTGVIPRAGSAVILQKADVLTGTCA